MKNSSPFTLLFFTLFLTACGGSKVVLSPNTPDISAAKARFPEYTFEQYEMGKAIYTKNCGSCHALHAPGSKTETTWAKSIPPMVEKVNKRGMIITPEGEALIFRYLLSQGMAH